MIIVVVNKIDKEGVNVDCVCDELLCIGIISEEWGGDVLFLFISVKFGEGIDELFEIIFFIVEFVEFVVNFDCEV